MSLYISCCVLIVLFLIMSVIKYKCPCLQGVSVLAFGRAHSKHGTLSPWYSANIDSAPLNFNFASERQRASRLYFKPVVSFRYILFFTLCREHTSFAKLLLLLHFFDCFLVCSLECSSRNYN